MDKLEELKKELQEAKQTYEEGKDMYRQTMGEEPPANPEDLERMAAELGLAANQIYHDDDPRKVQLRKKAGALATLALDWTQIHNLTDVAAGRIPRAQRELEQIAREEGHPELAGELNQVDAALRKKGVDAGTRQGLFTWMRNALRPPSSDTTQRLLNVAKQLLSGLASYAVESPESAPMGLDRVAQLQQRMQQAQAQIEERRRAQPPAADLAPPPLPPVKQDLAAAFPARQPDLVIRPGPRPAQRLGLEDAPLPAPAPAVKQRPVSPPPRVRNGNQALRNLVERIEGDAQTPFDRNEFLASFRRVPGPMTASLLNMTPAQDSERFTRWLRSANSQEVMQLVERWVRAGRPRIPDGELYEELAKRLHAMYEHVYRR
jgi:hypothetical protein